MTASLLRTLRELRLPARVALSLSVVAVACIACGGHEATHFVGTAMDVAAADSSVRLTLVLWPRTDSTFAGHLKVDMPIGIDGGVSAWHGKDGLALYSIADNGDTTNWGTRQSG